MAHGSPQRRTACLTSIPLHPRTCMYTHVRPRSYMAALLADAEAHGAVLALNTRVAGGWVDPLPHTATAGGTNSPGSSSGGSNDSSSSSSSSSSSNSKGNTPGPVARKVLELHTRAPSAPGGGGAPAAPGGAEVEVSHLRARWVVNAAGELRRPASRVHRTPAPFAPLLIQPCSLTASFATALTGAYSCACRPPRDAGGGHHGRTAPQRHTAAVPSKGRRRPRRATVPAHQHGHQFLPV